MLYVIAGIIGGIIGGLGMGAGTLLVPMLTLVIGMAQKEAQLLNMVAFVPMAIITLIINIKSGFIKWKYVLYVGVSGMLSAIGASFLISIIEGIVLRKAFGGFLVTLGVISLISVIVKKIKDKKKETLTSINVTKSDDDN